MERRFVTIKRSSNIDQRSLARRLAEIRELRRLVRQAEAKRRLESRETRLARRHSFEAWENT
jgi:DNA-binding HxlR family transcriptional regulator